MLYIDCEIKDLSVSCLGKVRGSDSVNGIRGSMDMFCMTATFVNISRERKNI